MNATAHCPFCRRDPQPSSAIFAPLRESALYVLDSPFLLTPSRQERQGIIVHERHCPLPLLSTRASVFLCDLCASARFHPFGFGTVASSLAKPPRAPRTPCLGRSVTVLRDAILFILCDLCAFARDNPYTPERAELMGLNPFSQCIPMESEGPLNPPPVELLPPRGAMLRHARFMNWTEKSHGCRMARKDIHVHMRG